jgi:hypothetical protein
MDSVSCWRKTIALGRGSSLEVRPAAARKGPRHLGAPFALQTAPPASALMLRRRISRSFQGRLVRHQDGQGLLMHEIERHSAK